jgi:small subunit ribosomal protein S11
MTEEKVTTEKNKDDKKDSAEELKSASAANDGKESAAASKQGKGKKTKKQILKGRATVKCTYNNTIVSIADINGAILGWASSGMMGFKGAKKATPYAATQVVANVSEKVKKYGLQELEVFVKGVGSGREASVRALSNNGFDLLLIKDITPIPHNGCRPKKPRRI